MLAAWRNPSRCACLKSMSFIIWKAARSNARGAWGQRGPAGQPPPRELLCSQVRRRSCSLSPLFFFIFFFIFFFTRQIEEEGSLLRGKAAGGAHLSLPSPTSLLPCLVQKHAPDAKSVTPARSREKSGPHL